MGKHTVPDSMVHEPSMARERLQAVEGLTHIGRLPVQVHVDPRLVEKHQPRAMLEITPAPSSKRTSSREP